MAAAGCPGKDVGDDTAVAEGFSVVAEGLEAGLMCVQGTAADDLWIVGADAGTGPTVLHYDGAALTPIATGHTGDLWWVQPTATGAVFVGVDGAILEHAGGVTTEIPGPAEVSFFGVWGASDDDLWAVGGDTSGGGPPVVWRNVTGTWAPFSDPVIDGFAAPDIFYKVHGTAADDLWIVGTAGILLHWDGATFTEMECGGDGVLFTVHVGGPFPVAVGGAGQALVCNFDGTNWVNTSPPFEPMMNGVSGRGDTLIATGQQGTVLRWSGTEWVHDELFLTTEVLHSVWIDEEGGIWSVGGGVNSLPIVDGVILYEGARTIPPL